MSAQNAAAGSTFRKWVAYKRMLDNMFLTAMILNSIPNTVCHL